MTSIAGIAARNRDGHPIGIPSWCTANESVLRAILGSYRGSGDTILIEATCNQVNQFGGYTGLTPRAFRVLIERLAAEAGVPSSQLLLGGDHLGPNPWKARPAAEAMGQACQLVRDYVAAGFTKIHLDASMACADDIHLAEARMADRAAELCAAAEAASTAGNLSYIIGTEVPVPGGETEALDTLAVTRPESALRTYELHRGALIRRGLGNAFERVIGLVVQPGVDFGNSQIFEYQPPRAAGLASAVMRFPGMVFEAHSTDYQSEVALRALVADHFAILKVGPELTFAYREAILAMAAMEAWLDVPVRSEILETIGAVMDEMPDYWWNHATAGAAGKEERVFGLSDRIRYYWPQPRLAQAVERLRANLDGATISPGLLSQYVGAMERAADETAMSARIIQHKVGAVVAKYRSACGAI